MACLFQFFSKKAPVCGTTMRRRRQHFFRHYRAGLITRSPLQVPGAPSGDNRRRENLLRVLLLPQLRRQAPRGSYARRSRRQRQHQHQKRPCGRSHRRCTTINTATATTRSRADRRVGSGESTSKNRNCRSSWFDCGGGRNGRSSSKIRGSRVSSGGQNRSVQHLVGSQARRCRKSQ